MPYIYNPTSKTYVALCRTEGGLSNDDNFAKYLPYVFIFHIKRIAIPPLRLMASFFASLTCLPAKSVPFYYRCLPVFSKNTAANVCAHAFTYNDAHCRIHA